MFPSLSSVAPPGALGKLPFVPPDCSKPSSHTHWKAWPTQKRSGLVMVVQGFDVSTTNQNDIVLFVVNEAANDQTLYLTSPEGRLRKVVSVKVGDVARITDEDKKAFAKEKQFWLDRLAPVSASK
jgi:hypothetical protein